MIHNDGNNHDSVRNSIYNQQRESNNDDQIRVSINDDNDWAFSQRLVIQSTTIFVAQTLVTIIEFQSMMNVCTTYQDDSFLSLLCYESEKDDEVTSIKDWSEKEDDDDSDGVGNTKEVHVENENDDDINFCM
ncbi:hypothetical protein E3N88_06115 [Mikania micrantha]|uniref:Uncharacterized protein n=1 Tax=Mikania micrantha TaxID=192012 RepID=A0A5N6PQS2_9ASTR|nr:hypothetical protein E3N88_06115 [Mikania micrantha]